MNHHKNSVKCTTHIYVFAIYVFNAFFSTVIARLISVSVEVQVHKEKLALSVRAVACTNFARKCVNDDAAKAAVIYVYTLVNRKYNPWPKRTGGSVLIYLLNSKNCWRCPN